MASKNSKVNKEKKELDLILAQLKKNYNDEASAEDPAEELAISDADSEFSEMLEKFFTSEAHSHNEADKSSDEYLSEDLLPTSSEESVNEAADPDLDEDVVTEDISSVSAEEIAQNEELPCVGDQFFERSESENHSMEDVDGVLQLMFSNRIPSTAESHTEESTEHVDDYAESDENSFGEEALTVEPEITLKNDSGTEPSLEEAFDDIAYPEDEDSFDDVISLVSNEIPEQEDDLYSDEISDEDYGVTPTFTVEDEDYSIDTDEHIQIEESVPDTVAPTPLIILDPESYTYDPLQDVLPRLSTVAVDGTEQLAPSQESDDNNVDEPDNTVVPSKNEALDSNDISLLLKFGYSEEVKAKIGENETIKAINEKVGDYNPESHKIPYGYCGKEFSDKDQAKKIKEKYKSDKSLLIVQIIIISLLTVAMIAVETFFEFLSDRSSYLVVNAVELMLIAVSAVLINRKLISGILGIVRFEANLYSILAYLIFAYTTCNIAVALIYIIKFPAVDTSGFMVFGLSIMLYMLLVLVSELINCLREAEAFNLICRSNNIYTAQKHDAPSSTVAKGLRDTGSSYRLTKTSIISGYFRKSSRSVSNNVNLIYIIGIVPILSLIVGCTSALVSENVMQGIFSMMITTLLCIPFAYIILPPVTEYIFAASFRNKRIALVGSDTAENLAKVESLFFDDTDAIEIISYTEIHPQKNAESENALAIARRVFTSLDGPLGEYVKTRFSGGKDEEIKAGEVVINSIADNGIDIYFESSTNVLIGDKTYMQTHNIKVKTDSSLKSAISGVDRSTIYMAFDGVPKLGFIITSRIRPEFAKTAEVLDENAVKVYVDSYEPEINDLYFEQNATAGSSTVAVCKSEEYESTDYKPICDGNIVCASSSFDLARAILDCRKIVARRKRNQRTILALILCGLLFSALFTALLSIDHAVFILSGLKAHVSLVFNAVMILSLAPAIVSIFKSREHTATEKDKSKETE